MKFLKICLIPDGCNIDENTKIYKYLIKHCNVEANLPYICIAPFKHPCLNNQNVRFVMNSMNTLKKPGLRRAEAVSESIVFDWFLRIRIR